MKPETYLYLHIPFCRHRCEYCSFYSVDEFRWKAAYLEALKKELSRLSDAYPVRLKTVYFGGGSPAVLSIEEMQELFDVLRSTFELALEECTIEMNPHQVKPDYVRGLLEIGFNRVSLGVQSLDQSYLDAIGRKSLAPRSVTAFQILRQAGFDNISLDLIYGGPGSSVDSVKRDLDAFLELGPEHISTYCLSIDEGCALDQKLRQGLIHLPEDDLIADQMEFITSHLETNGFNRYEISNYARPGRESKHNLAYWTYRDTLGAGAAAVYTYQNRRVENVPDIEKYIALCEAGAFPPGELTVLSDEDRRLEAIMMGLRLKEGISVSEFNRRYAANLLEDYGAWIAKFEKTGLLELSGDRLSFRGAGLNLSNAILSELF